MITVSSNEITCGGRNPFQGKYFFTHEREVRKQICCEEDSDLDYKNSDYSNFPILNILKGRNDNIGTSMKKLNTNSKSRILIYVSSHGGNNFLRIRTKTVILSEEMHRTLWEMYLKNRYSEILFIVDTCEAITLFDSVDVPNVYFVGSSLKDQKAISYLFDDRIMSPLSDRFTYMFQHIVDNLLNDQKFDYKINKLFEEISEQHEFLYTYIGVRNTVNRDVNLN